MYPLLSFVEWFLSAISLVFTLPPNGRLMCVFLQRVENCAAGAQGGPYRAEGVVIGQGVVGGGGLQGVRAGGAGGGGRQLRGVERGEEGVIHLRPIGV